jgi:hypothetical protein
MNDTPTPRTNNQSTCPHDPRLLAGKPIGQYPCPVCGEMVIAGLAHDPEPPSFETGSPTPRTDDNEDGWAYNFQYDSFCSLIDDPLPWAEFSRTLERELTTVTEQLTAAREELVETRKDFMCLAELLDGHDATECRMNLVRLKEQRDRLAEAMRKIQKVGLVAVDAFDELDRIDEIVDEALAAVKGGSDDFDQFRPFDF